MAGTPEGGRKSAATNKKHYGLNFYTTIGRMGGRSSHGALKGFANPNHPMTPQEAGRIGGLTKSSRHELNK